MKILRNKTYKRIIETAYGDGIEKGIELAGKDKFSSLNPCISSLKELRNNTWDKERIDWMIYWLESYIDE